MKTLGLIGGMSWVSSAEYYRLVNEAAQRRLGGHHNAPSLLLTVDFDAVERLQRAGDWESLGALLVEAARRLEDAGAELLVLCTNTMHRLAPAIEAAVGIPLVHIVDPTAAAIRAAGLKRVALLGTRHTMEQDFYTGRLESRHGIRTLVPPPTDRRLVHDVIYEELCRGIVREGSRAEYRRIIGELAGAGAEGVILGCTEIGLLVSAADSPLPVFDTTRLHAEAAVAAALAEGT